MRGVKGSKMVFRTNKPFRIGLALIATAGLVSTVGCSSRGGDEASNQVGSVVEQFAIVTPEKESDYGWNQQGIWGAKEAADELDIALDDNSDVGYDNTETILSQVAEADNDLIIAHASGFNTAGHRVGTQTGVPTMVIDFDMNEPGQVATLITQAQEGAYLAEIGRAHV